MLASIGPSIGDRGFLLVLPSNVRGSLRDLLFDLRYSIRTLKKSPGFAAVAVLTLALGIGANTAVFTVVNGVLLRPLPYVDQDRLVTLWSARPDDGRRFLPSYPDFQAWHEQSESFEHMAFIYGDEITLRTDEGLDPMLTAFVSGEFFSALQGRSVLGIPFGEIDGDAVGAEKLVVLKYREWQGRFGGDLDIVGKTLSFTDGSYVVAAVMAEGVDYPTWADMWIPFTPATADRYGLSARDRRIDTRVLARLRSDVELCNYRRSGRRDEAGYQKGSARRGLHTLIEQFHSCLGQAGQLPGHA